MGESVAFLKKKPGDEEDPIGIEIVNDHGCLFLMLVLLVDCRHINDLMKYKVKNLHSCLHVDVCCY